ncbi:hypothetical protein AAFF_G00180790 [Aldrovandia affinis]|uniref:Uncharacterized protein n=1 Tax=Aldrovandia affinis TaxID=143900 RepID=A0AAD7WWP9_9TELE|nr:hypothetical protein AAFF_G00180790 [Aldrovandia affinis]
MADSLLLRVKLLSASARQQPTKRLPVLLSPLQRLISRTPTGCAWAWHSGLPLPFGDCFSSSTVMMCMNIKGGMDLNSCLLQDKSQGLMR